MKSFFVPIEKAEQKVQEATLQNHIEDMTYMRRALEYVIDMYGVVSGGMLGELGKLQAARLLLTVRSVYTMRMIEVALLRGYYQQALTLLRMVAENRLVSLDIENHVETLEALLERKGELGKGKLNYTSMATRRGDGFSQDWKNYYGKLSSFGAHPRSDSINTLARQDPTTGVPIVLPIPSYDEYWANVSIRFTCRELIGMIRVIGKAVGTAREEQTKLDDLQLSWPLEEVCALMDYLHNMW